MQQEETDPTADARAKLLQAALAHVPFDGWTETSFRAAIAASGLPEGLARALYPRGGVDLALAYHRDGDTQMTRALATPEAREAMARMRYSERVAHAIRTRLELIEDRELIRRGTTLFALPQHAAEGSKAIWGTADAIWKALDDNSRDFNWYSKRATLSAVYGATVLYWLGDDSPGRTASWEFLDRRIADVMRIEKMKAGFRDNPLARAFRASPMGRGFDTTLNRAGGCRPPTARDVRDDLPGHSSRPMHEDPVEP
ncbi:MAG: COQ9 family protein [Pseudorhodobacter sp.]